MIAEIIYLCCAIIFILAVASLASPKTARNGNFWAMVAMFVAVTTCMVSEVKLNQPLILAVLLCSFICGFAWGKLVKMTALPQMVALLNGIGGLASALIVYADAKVLQNHSVLSVLCLVIGFITFSGSMVAFAKLQGILRKNVRWIKWFTPFVFAATIYFAYEYGAFGMYLNCLILFSLLSGICLCLPIGGADMPVVVSVLNSLSGWAVVLVGVSISDILLVIVGTIIGASGSILSYIMSKAMNRRLWNILWPNSSFNNQNTEQEHKSVKKGTPEEAAFFLENAKSVIIVPGFGMAAAQAQNAVKNLADLLENKYNAEVKFAIHPVAGRMPGHMNVLLAEAKISYENVFEMNDINPQFAMADAVYVIGANDVTNPAAKDDKNSPLYGMPILEVEKAKMVFFVKRTMASGYSGVENRLFYAPNTIMLFGDAKKVTEEIIKYL